MEGIDPNYANKVSNTQKYVLPALAALILAGTGTYYYSNSNSTKQVQNNTNLVQTTQVARSYNPLSGFFGKYSDAETQKKIHSGLEERLNSLEEIVGTIEKDKTTGKPLVYRIDMNFDGDTEEVKVTTAKSSMYEVKYANQKPQNVTLDLPYVGENILSRYFITPDDKVIQTIQKNPQMVCDLKDYAQKLNLWTSSTDSDFTLGYVKLYSIANNPKCK